MSTLTRTKRQVAKSAGAVASAELASKQPRIYWTDLMNRTLIDYYLEEMKRHGTPSNGIKSQQWTAITFKFNMEFPGLFVTSPQIQSNWQYMKTKWRINHDLRNKSGFGWDVELQNFDCDKDVFDAYCEKTPKAAPFWQAPLKFYDDLNRCHAHCSANGAYASSSPSTHSCAPVHFNEEYDMDMFDMDGPNDQISEHDVANSLLAFSSAGSVQGLS